MTITKPTTKEIKAAKTAGGMGYKRMEAQSEANRTMKAHHVARYGDHGLTLVLNDWDLEFRRDNKMSIPTIIETYAPMDKGWWYHNHFGF